MFYLLSLSPPTFPREGDNLSPSFKFERQRGRTRGTPRRDATPIAGSPTLVAFGNEPVSRPARSIQVCPLQDLRRSLVHQEPIRRLTSPKPLEKLFRLVVQNGRMISPVRAQPGKAGPDPV